MAFSEPEVNLAHLHFDGNAVVVDLGSGSGHYSFAAAKRMQNGHGKVIAVDVQRDMLVKLKREAGSRGLHNLEIVHGDLDEARSTGLRDESVDAVIVSNILFQLEERDIFAQEVTRILKEGGEMLAVDWTDSWGGLGPVSSAVVAEDIAVALFERHGLTLLERFIAGEHHWGLIFIRRASSN